MLTQPISRVWLGSVQRSRHDSGVRMRAAKAGFGELPVPCLYSGREGAKPAPAGKHQPPGALQLVELAALILTFSMSFRR